MTATPLIGNWTYPTAIRFGAGRLVELGDACIEAGISRPLLVTDPPAGEPDPATLARILGWLDAERIRTLNVAGPRESGGPGIHERARRLLRALLSGYNRRP